MKFCGLLFFVSVTVASAQSDGTAIGALKLLPKDVSKRLVRIEARDGAPAPERWHLLVHDPVSPRGVREFVVAGGKIVASRTLSQFADSLKPEDVVGADSVKFNSDQVARLASLYAVANGGRVGAINYELTRETPAAGPVWRATVLDFNGDQIGVLVVTAAKGSIVRRDGLELEPAPELLRISINERPLPPVRAGTDTQATGSQPRPQPVRAATPEPTPKPGAMSRVGNSVKRLFGGNPEKAEKPPR